jgi:uncharacterized membrane protein (UPF0127 family)
MRSVIVRNLNRPDILPVKAGYCSSFLCQLRGLTFRRSLGADEGLLLVQNRDSRVESAIHMMFVWIDLAIVWINSDCVVVDGCLAKSWRPAYISRRPARYVLEMEASRVGDFQNGEQIKFEEVSLA